MSVDINEGIKEYKRVLGAVLLDVRRKDEYTDGHIPGSINVPVQTIYQVGAVVENKSIPLYVYCRSGIRSKRAEGLLKGMGYKNVTDIGGIIDYRGNVEK